MDNESMSIAGKGPNDMLIILKNGKPLAFFGQCLNGISHNKP
jgi:hypothetical protein